MKTALITGGSKGIGLGVAHTLKALGYGVAITSRNREAAQEAERQLAQTEGGAVLALQADVRSLQDQQKAVDQILQEWGQLDVVVANAGLGHFAPVDEMDPAEFEKVVDTNLTGVFYTVKATVEALKKTEGYLFTISSLAGTNFFAQGSAYNASKFGLTGFTQSIMLDLRPYGIKVATIMPGSVATHFNGHTPSPNDHWKIQPEDIGELIEDLLKLNSRTLPSKIEVRPSLPPSARK
ncbi:MAG: SDR family oxidoreductase [Schleiferiaceae bacterium]|nr:SDR family oxidoreductase [Schleiferiaceae bacterium]